MKKPLLVLMLVIGLLALTVAPSHARVHWHGGVFIGVGPWWGPPYPYWWYPSPYYYYPPPYYYYPPPTVVIEQPPVYIQQPAPSPAPPSVPVESYWYYCQSAQAYYPSVQQCPEAWIRVPPRAP